MYDRSYVEEANSAVQITKRVGKPSTEGGTDRNIFVFVNGMLGQHTDLRYVMQEVQVCFPDCIILPSMSNQGAKTLGDIHVRRLWPFEIRTEKKKQGHDVLMTISNLCVHDELEFVLAAGNGPEALR